MLKLSTFSTFRSIFSLVLFQGKRDSQYFLTKQQISAFSFHGNRITQSIKFASGIITVNAGEKDGKEWIDT